MIKKLQQQNHDGYSPVLLVARDSQILAWRASANRLGMSLSQWAAAQLDDAALGDPPSR